MTSKWIRFLPGNRCAHLAVAAMIFVFTAGCGDSEGSAGEGAGDTAGEGPDSDDGVSFDDILGQDTQQADSADTEIDTLDTEEPDTIDTVDPDVPVPTDTEGGDTEGGDVEGGDTEDSDTGGTQTDLPVGAACGPGIGTCVAGATCVEVSTGSANSQCYALVPPGEQCGPGFGQCADGNQCAKPKGSDVTICLQSVGAGDSCLPIQATCGPGLLCVTSDTIANFALTEVISAEPSWGSTAGVGRLSVDSNTGEVWVTHPPGNRILRYSLAIAFGIGTTVVFDTTPTGALSAPQGVFARRDLTPGGVIVADSGNQRGGFSTILPDFTVFGTEGEGAGQFPPGAPADVALVNTAAGVRIYASVPSRNEVQIFTANDGLKYQQALTGGGVPLVAPTGLFAAGDLVWVVDSGAATVRVFNATGAEVNAFGGSQASVGGLSAPHDVACSTDQSLCAVTDPNAGRVVVFSGTGTYLWDLSAPPGYENWSPTGVAFYGDFLYISDAASGTLLELEPVLDEVCAAPLGLGSVCSGTQAPCAAGLSCLPKSPESPVSLCKVVADSGEPCGTDSVSCGTGLDCVAGPASAGYKAVCLPAVGQGQACGPGLAGCQAGFGCNWDGPAHNQRLCYPRVGEGQDCNAYQQGGCLPGFSCELTILGNSQKTCKPIAQLDQPCGKGLASCADGLSCTRTGAFIGYESFCRYPVSVGAACGFYEPECEDGSTCNIATAGGTQLFCYADSATGQPCAAPGQGLCSDDSAMCMALDSSGVNNSCLAKTNPAGGACGQPGTAPCVDGTTCIVNQIPATSATCHPDRVKGEACGVGAGTCDSSLGFGCFITNAAGLTGDCRALQPEFGLCGQEINDVGACDLLEAACICEDPFIAGACDTNAADFVCVPNVDVFDICAVNAVDTPGLPYSRGWVGLCPGGTNCQIASVGPDPFNPVFAQWAIFICKQQVGTGQACDLLRGCAAGQICACAGQECTVDQYAAGTAGVCQPAP